jgi:cellulose synthase/poly-beta-1,6-N-acetylglucosamine synthase-like glycosyltransferase
LVSCVCPTYNRPPHYHHLLEEAIESFLRQDYPNKELIVLNDCPGQELICDGPGVRVVNVGERFLSIYRRQTERRRRSGTRRAHRPVGRR